jgi:hypothetical protein
MINNRLLATGAYRFRYHPDAPLTEYLRLQQSVICASAVPGPLSQRAFENPNPWDPSTGNTYGGFNPDLWLKQAVRGFTPFDVDSCLGGAGTCSARVFLSPHHFLMGCGAVHETGETASIKYVGLDFRLGYQVEAHTGTIVKLLPANWAMYTNDSARLPCYARMHNTYIGANGEIDAERQWVMPVLAFNTLGSSIYLPDDPLFNWVKPIPSDPYKMASGGDSGSPIFCGFFGEPVILSFISGGTFLGIQHASTLYWEIVSVMNSLATAFSDPLAGSYRPQTVDLRIFD